MTKKILKAAQLTISISSLASVTPSTLNQQKAREAWDDGDNIILAGTAGSGKTFLAMHMGLEAVMSPNSDFDNLTIIRSVVPTRDQGFLPGTQKEKEDAFATPYKQITSELFNDPAAYTKMSAAKQIHFESTSFIRGQTFNNAVIIVDEMQNLNFHELDSVITRVGKDCRIIFCGDYYQSDFKSEHDRGGLLKFLHVIDHMNAFTTVTFGWQDIVRSGLVRDYIMAKEMLKITEDR